MAKVSLSTIKDWFKTGLVPTQMQFWDTWDSFFHKDEPIPVEQVTGMSGLLSQVNAILTATNQSLKISDVVDNLTTADGTKPLSAQQGMLLKYYIDAINVLLTSDELTLDTLQEIVDFIQLNKATLDTLGIANIAGLQSALNTLQTNIDNVGGGGSWYLENVDDSGEGTSAVTEINVSRKIIFKNAMVFYDSIDGFDDGVCDVSILPLLRLSSDYSTVRSIDASGTGLVFKNAYLDNNIVEYLYLREVEQDNYIEEFFLFNNVNRYKLAINFPSSAAVFGNQRTGVVLNQLPPYEFTSNSTTIKGQININIENLGATSYAVANNYESVSTQNFCVFTTLYFVAGSKFTIGNLSSKDPDNTTGNGVYLLYNGASTVSLVKRVNGVVTTVASSNISAALGDSLLYQVMVYREGNTAYVKIRNPLDGAVIFSTSTAVGLPTMVAPYYLGVNIVENNVTATTGNVIGCVHQLIVGGKRPAKLIHF